MNFLTQSTITLVVVAIVVLRFIRRELTERTIRRRTVWIRPAILICFTLYLAVLTLSMARFEWAFLLDVLAIGALVGVLTGWALVSQTTFRPATVANAVRVKGSRITAAVWIGALAIRLLARYLIPAHGPASQLALNCGLVGLIAVAFVIVAVAFWRAVDQFPPVLTEPIPNANSSV